jgi:hypothetical protein
MKRQNKNPATYDCVGLFAVAHIGDVHRVVGVKRAPHLRRHRRLSQSYPQYPHWTIFMLIQ